MEKEENTKLIAVRFIKAHSKYAYFADDKGKVFESDLPQLINGGYVAHFPGDDGEGNENPLPEDLEGRAVLFENGIKTVAEAKELGKAVQEFNSIGPATYKAIQAYNED